MSLVGVRSRSRLRAAAVQAAVFFLIGLGAAAASAERSSDDELFRAMQDEMERSSDSLAIPGMSPPYFLAYRVRDDFRQTLEARYTALVDSSASWDRQLAIDLRVGSPSLDNSNFYSQWGDIWGPGIGLVNEDSYSALRHELWFQTDAAYKQALESLAGKQAYLQAHPPKKILPDFAPAPPSVSLEQEVPPAFTPSLGDRCVRRAAEALLDCPALQDWRVSWTGRLTRQHYLNSEGSRHLKSVPRVYFEASATLQANDGQRLSGSVSRIACAAEDLPAAEILAEEARGMARDLQEMASGDALEDYVGPVLFAGEGAAQFLAQLFVAQLSLPRKPLTTEEWLSNQLPLGKLAPKVKRRIMPAFMTIVDRPLLESWEGRRLAGTMTVDDEGVECRDVTLVENGRLVGLPLTRQPVEGFESSNGHARHVGRQRVDPAVTNLVVPASRALEYDKLVREMQRLCREQEMEYGLLIRRLEEIRVTDRYRQVDREETDATLLSPPLVVYKVYARDGRMEPVRGLGFDEVTVRSLRDITAVGKDTEAYNLLIPFSGTGSYYTASIVTPSILVEEMELKSVAVQEPLTVLGNPLFE